MKTDSSTPRREFPFVVTAEYGMGVRNSGIFCKAIVKLDKDAMVRNGELSTRAASIMGLLTMEFANGVRGTLIFSKPVAPDDLFSQHGLCEIIEFDELKETSLDGKN